MQRDTVSTMTNRTPMHTDTTEASICPGAEGQTHRITFKKKDTRTNGQPSWSGKHSLKNKTKKKKTCGQTQIEDLVQLLQGKELGGHTE